MPGEKETSQQIIPSLLSHWSHSLVISQSRRERGTQGVFGPGKWWKGSTSMCKRVRQTCKFMPETGRFPFAFLKIPLS